jgi:hypothetical protein
MINTVNKNKILLTIIGILLVANIVLVSFFMLRKDGSRHEKHQDRKAMITRFLKDEIGFSTTQLLQYDTLSDNHRKKMKDMMDSLKSSRDIQFKQLAAGNFSDSVMNMVADQSAASQKAMELHMFSHLKNVRLLCKQDQLPKFDSLFGKLLNKRSGDGRKKDSERK